VRCLAGAVVLAGCFHPTPPEGAPCTTSVDCPASQVCSAGTCASHPATDAPADGDPPGGCTPIVAGSGALTAPRIAPIRLDGMLDDWTACFVALDTGNATIRDLNGGGAYATGRFSIAHDDTRFYIAAEVMGVPPLGDQPPPAVYENDSISIYLDADGVFDSATYDADAIQIVIDHANRSQQFHASQLTNFASAVRGTGNLFTLELAIQPSTLGATAFAPTIGFDIGFEGGDGVDQTSELLWYVACAPPACGCTNGDSAPYCDARQLGTATLAD